MLSNDIFGILLIGLAVYGFAIGLWAMFTGITERFTPRPRVLGDWLVFTAITAAWLLWSAWAVAECINGQDNILSRVGYHAAPSSKEVQG